MIAYLEGLVFKKNNKNLILLVNNIGYLVSLSVKDLEVLKLEQKLSLFIHTHVKEDALDLYGFLKQEQLEFFQQLISVSGVGPKSALNIISLASLEDLKKAITSGDPSILQQVSGIGKKTAERLVVELKEKIITDLSVGFEQKLIGDQQLIEALLSLGYKEREIREALNIIKPEGELGEKVKQTLKFLAK
ncbi:Holliday junction branch migration protein RuvA [Candidatus Nomurabacteria bacterium]|nr:Holliday junction branch migration protein RuvA [Candidatus Nomurabacteria bacterium]